MVQQDKLQGKESPGSHAECSQFLREAVAIGAVQAPVDIRKQLGKGLVQKGLILGRLGAE